MAKVMIGFMISASLSPVLFLVEMIPLLPVIFFVLLSCVFNLFSAAIQYRIAQVFFSFERSMLLICGFQKEPSFSLQYVHEMTWNTSRNRCSGASNKSEIGSSDEGVKVNE